MSNPFRCFPNREEFCALCERGTCWRHIWLINPDCSKKVPPASRGFLKLHKTTQSRDEKQLDVHWSYWIGSPGDLTWVSFFQAARKWDNQLVCLSFPLAHFWKRLPVKVAAFFVWPCPHHVTTSIVHLCPVIGWLHLCVISSSFSVRFFFFCWFYDSSALI